MLSSLHPRWTPEKREEAFGLRRLPYFLTSENNKMTEENKKLKIPPVAFIVAAFAVLIVIGIATR